MNQPMNGGLLKYAIIDDYMQLEQALLYLALTVLSLTEIEAAYCIGQDQIGLIE